MNVKTINLFTATVLFLLTVYIPCARASVLIAPTDQRINYYGRIDFSTPETPKYSWAGVIIEACFTGTTIGMKVNHNNAYYDIEIDGNVDTIIGITAAGNYLFTTSLSAGTHTVRIKLRSEDHYTVASFQGLLLEEGQDLQEPPQKPLRKIEFIGDSYTAGYGVESPGRTCSSEQLNQYTNVNRTFAANVTKAFHAQSIILGWSGEGMVKNYNTQTTDKRSPDPFPFYYDRMFGATDEKKWDFSTWTPELVVICLGTNDYTYNRNPESNPAPDDSMYIGDYHKFIARISANYPGVSIVCVSTGDATFEKNVRQVVSEQHSLHNNPLVFFAPYPANMENTGCDWHPSLTDNHNVASILIDTIMSKLDWDTATATQVQKNVTRQQHIHTDFSVSVTRDYITLQSLSPAILNGTYSLISLDGREYASAIADAKGRCTFSTTSVTGGIYLIGSISTGWKKMVLSTH